MTEKAIMKNDFTVSDWVKTIQMNNIYILNSMYIALKFYKDKMTEKRFEKQDNIILDAEGEPLKSIDEIVDVLNELDGENDFLYDNIIKFEKENERIKKVLDTHLNKSYVELNKFESLKNPSNPERVRKQIIIRDAEIMLLIRILQEIDGLKSVYEENEQLIVEIQKLKNQKK